MCSWADGLVSAGAEVDVFLRHPASDQLTLNSVRYHFVPDINTDMYLLMLPFGMFRQVRARCVQLQQTKTPCVIHLSGLLYPLQTRLLRWMIPASIPIVLQHHGSLPWAAGIRRMVQRWGLRPVDGVMFAAQELADTWKASNVLSNQQHIYEVMETSTHFGYQNRATARARTQMTGQPLLLWTGNLTDNKDPLTILQGFAYILSEFPQARLYMAYREAELLEQVTDFIQTHDLTQAVTLLGETPHDQMQDVYNSADIFVQGSAKEGSGIALLEALACGVIPVVSDIPTFRVLTDHGRVGQLWRRGDVQAFTQALTHVLHTSLETQSQQARQYFSERWTFTAIGQDAISCYQAVWDARQG